MYSRFSVGERAARPPLKTRSQARACQRDAREPQCAPHTRPAHRRAAVSLSSPPASNLATQILIRLWPIPWRLARACSDSPPRNSWTTWRLNSIECVRCLAMGFLLESPVQLADSHLPHLSTPRGALHRLVQTRPSRRESLAGSREHLFP